MSGSLEDEAALEAAAAGMPTGEGVNIRLARDIVGTVTGGGKRYEKKISHWRSIFMTLSDLLCWPVLPFGAPPPPPAEPVTEFPLAGGFSNLIYPGLAFHPEFVAERINFGRGESARAADADFQVCPSEAYHRKFAER